ncbi:hypothetical protein Pan181_26490 [Aeoliella mucimassa]|uniref:Uncharacterized protein n=1 Tax=Aeoliella mucimassa TaxID=2527972 RepID=A0A518ANZ2_9BACT|nr:hypothetical protein Pan181_26490 [Aeoliella mucimassa]
MQYDTDKVDEAVLGLLLLGTSGRQRLARTAGSQCDDADLHRAGLVARTGCV